MEEHREMLKSYYNLSEDQLSRLRDLLKKVSLENSQVQSLPRSLRKMREGLFLGKLIMIGILCITAFPLVALTFVVVLLLGNIEGVRYILFTNLMAWPIVLICWVFPLLVLIFSNRFIRFSKQRETDRLMNAANIIINESKNIPQDSLPQEIVTLKYFMSVMKKGTKFNQNEKQREDFRIHRLKQLLRKINPKRTDIPESKWGTPQFVQKWIVIADVIFCLVLWHHLIFRASASFTLEKGIIILIILLLGMIISYKLLLQFQKKKAQQELEELLELADEDAKRIKEQQLELSEELIQELDDCVYELSQAYGMTV